MLFRPATTQRAGRRGEGGDGRCDAWDSGSTDADPPSSSGMRLSDQKCTFQHCYSSGMAPASLAQG